MPPKIRKADESLLESFGFAFSEPPVREITRRSKHEERWQTARDLCQRYPGQALKVLTYNQASSAYGVAKDINNGEHKQFAGDFSDWRAVAAKDPQPENEKAHSVWLTYSPAPDTDRIQPGA